MDLFFLFMFSFCFSIIGLLVFLWTLLYTYLDCFNKQTLSFKLCETLARYLTIETRVHGTLLMVHRFNILNVSSLQVCLTFSHLLWTFTRAHRFKPGLTCHCFVNKTVSSWFGVQVDGGHLWRVMSQRSALSPAASSSSLFSALIFCGNSETCPAKADV